MLSIRNLLLLCVVAGCATATIDAEVDPSSGNAPTGGKADDDLDPAALSTVFERLAVDPVVGFEGAVDEGSFVVTDWGAEVPPSTECSLQFFAPFRKVDLNWRLYDPDGTPQPFTMEASFFYETDEDFTADGFDFSRTKRYDDGGEQRFHAWYDAAENVLHMNDESRRAAGEEPQTQETLDIELTPDRSGVSTIRATRSVDRQQEWVILCSF